MRCTAPVRGHRTASGAARCPVHGRRSSYRSYAVQSAPRRPGGGGASAGSSSRRTSGGSGGSRSAATRRTLEPIRRAAERQAAQHPERRDLFLCHAWDDRQGAAKDLHDLLESHGATVWFSEKDVVLGSSLLREIDRGLRKSRIGIVLVTPALLKTLEAEGIADKELSALLATDRVIPVAHGTTFEALRDVSPLLAARSGLNTADSSLADVAAMVADTVCLEDES